jgi:hypothetical protein
MTAYERGDISLPTCLFYYGSAILFPVRYLELAQLLPRQIAAGPALVEGMMGADPHSGALSTIPKADTSMYQRLGDQSGSSCLGLWSNK